MSKTTHYNATIEVATRELPDVDDLLDQLEDYHASIGQSERGWLSVTMTLPADNLAQATRTALAVVAAATGAEPIVCEVLTEDESEARQGWEPVPELVSVTEAAETLGVSRQAVLQRIDSKSLPAIRVGRDFVIPRAAVGPQVSEQLRQLAKLKPVIDPKTIAVLRQLSKTQFATSQQFNQTLAKIGAVHASMSTPEMRRAIAKLNQVASLKPATPELVLEAAEEVAEEAAHLSLVKDDE